MEQLSLSLLRGVCQMPAYAAAENGYFAEEGLGVSVHVEATAGLVPDRLRVGEAHFGVIPWTRAAAEASGSLLVVAGSGFEEAALVVRAGIEPAEVRKVAVPLRGGMKDLTALGLLGDLGWEGAEQVRQPSGDGAIIALFGQGVDAASMVEPYATMMAELGVGRVVRRTGDLWPGAPGCCLTTTRAFRDRMPAAVAAVVRAFARGHDWVRDRPDEAAELGARYIGIHARFIRAALDAHPPRLDGIRNLEAMASVMAFMRRLGYTNGHGHECVDLEFLDQLRA